MKRLLLLLAFLLPGLSFAQDAATWNASVRQSGLLDVSLAASYDFTAADSVIYAVYSRVGGSTLAQYDCTAAEMTCADGSVTIKEAVSDLGCAAGRTCWHELIVRETGDPARAVWLSGPLRVKRRGERGSTTAGQQTLAVNTVAGGTLTIAAISSLGTNTVAPDAVLSSGKTDEYCLTYEETGETWQWQACAAGAPVDAPYLVGSADATLSNEVVISNLSELNTHLGTSIADGAHTTDTNAQTLCTGTNVYLDGEGNCDTITPGMADLVEDLSAQLGSTLDGNGHDVQFDDGDGILDDSGNETLLFHKVTSAQNYATVTNAALGAAPEIAAAGDDTNIDVVINPKNTADIVTTGTGDRYWSSNPTSGGGFRGIETEQFSVNWGWAHHGSYCSGYIMLRNDTPTGCLSRGTSSEFQLDGSLPGYGIENSVRINAGSSSDAVYLSIDETDYAVLTAEGDFEIGIEDDGSDEYLRIDPESGAPPSADCDSDTERGRMIYDYTNHRLYICGGASRGWDYATINN